MSTAARIDLLAVPGLPMIGEGDDLAGIICRHCAETDIGPRDGDIVIVAQKIVSKAEGRHVDLRNVVPSSRAIELAGTVGKDPRLVETILSESRRVVRSAPNVLIVEHRLGLVMANAGVDQSNVGSPPGTERALLLPEDPDASAERLREGIRALAGCEVAVVINDSFGRAWRMGTVGVAIGAAGLPSLDDRRGKPDLFGRPLEVTIVGLADEVAAAASLVMGQGAEARPVVVLRGLTWSAAPSPAQSVCRPQGEDLFR